MVFLFCFISVTLSLSLLISNSIAATREGLMDTDTFLYDLITYDMTLFFLFFVYSLEDRVRCFVDHSDTLMQGVAVPPVMPAMLCNESS